MEKNVLVEYSTNNSGGSDWLSESDWKKLEEAGWRLYGFDNFVYTDKGEHEYDEEGLPKRKGVVPAQANYAWKWFDARDKAVREFEELTGQDATAEGCNCCGAPHTFWFYEGEERNYASGEALSEYLVGEDLSKLTKRELLARIKKQD